MPRRSNRPPDDGPPAFRTAAQHAYEFLRAAILGGRLAGGERIDQDAVARQLGLSRMPVREAIRRLESEGFVVSRPNRGSVVTALGPEAMLEVFEIRSVLEGLAVSLAIPALTDAVLADLEHQVRRMRDAERKPGAWIELHDAFHDSICRLAGRPRLAALARNLRQSALPYVRLYLATYQQAEIPGFEHQTLLDAIKRGDPRVAEAAMREHVMSAATGLVAFLRDSELYRKPRSS